MHRLLLDETDILDSNQDRIIIKSKENLSHFNVLRINNNEKIEIASCDGSSNIKIYLCQIIGRSKKEISLEIIEELNSNHKKNIFITLYQSSIKSAKLELVVQKAVELGVSSINIYDSERSQMQKNIKIDRLNKISNEASMQSKRNSLCLVEQAGNLDTVLSNKHDIKIFMYENSDCKFKEILRDVKASNIAVYIGPEGGFTQDEVNLAKNKGAYIASLGNNILRAETAAIASVSNIIYEFKL